LAAYLSLGCGLPEPTTSPLRQTPRPNYERCRSATNESWKPLF
jgi:hypothetical protein